MSCEQVTTAPFAPVVTCPSIIAFHGLGDVCQTLDPIPRLAPCSMTSDVITTDTRYMCTIIDGPPTGPTEDAYIEWHWYTVTSSGIIPVHLSGKFIFVASAAYIQSQYALNGNYNGVNTPPSGIGMFNPSNHNP